MSSKILRSTTLAIAGLFATLPLAAAPMEAGPVAVSPGGVSDFTAAAGSCPSFDWSGVADDQPVELAIYRVDQAGELEPVLVESLPAGARGWSPAADQCLAAGGRYAWMVRGNSGEGTGEWSEARLFEIAGLPSDEEVRLALETLHRYREGRAGDVGEGFTPSRVPERGASTPVESPSTVQMKAGPEGEDEENLAALVARLAAREPAPPASPQVITAPSSFSLNLAGDISLGGAVFRGTTPFIHNDGGATFDNTAVGLDALTSLQPGFLVGSQNSAFGFNALSNTTLGLGNTAIGANALAANTEGNVNTGIGLFALDSNTVGDANVAVGVSALTDNTTGSNNTAFGTAALANNSTGLNNTALGHRALYTVDGQSSNTAVGAFAMEKTTTGSSSVAVGPSALRENTEGGGNVAVGRLALGSNTTGLANTAVGDLSLQDNTTSYANTAVGKFALQNNTTGAGNAAVGARAMRYNTDGHFNTALGREAGINWTTGDYNIAIGAGAYGVTGENGRIRIGGNSRQIATHIEGISGALGVFPTDVCIGNGDQLGPCSTSSARFKRDVKPLGDLSDSLSALQPVSFRYKEEFAGDENPEIQYGFIAEEVARIFPSLVTTDDEGRPHTVRYDLLTPLLLNEAQRQDEEVAELRRLLAERERKHEQAIADLEKRLERLAKKKRFRR